jgi:hypothetical protein
MDDIILSSVQDRFGMPFEFNFRIWSNASSFASFFIMSKLIVVQLIPLVILFIVIIPPNLICYVIGFIAGHYEDMDFKWCC